MSEIYRIEFVPQFLQIQELIFLKDPVVLISFKIDEGYILKLEA